MKEIWKEIDGYNGAYLVSNYGRILSNNLYAHKQPRILSTPNHSSGYKHVALSSNGKSKLYLVHRLVAEAFLENPNGYEFVNHKDENKANNRADNLEWCTKSYNATYSLELHPERKTAYARFFGGKRFNGKPPKHTEKVLQYSKSGELLNEFSDVVDANAKTGIKNCAIIACCKGKQKTAFGYIWKFA